MRPTASKSSGVTDVLSGTANHVVIDESAMQLAVLDMINEGDKVTVEAETDGKMLNGRRHNTVLCP
jgi:hypothetical protein